MESNRVNAISNDAVKHRKTLLLKCRHVGGNSAGRDEKTLVSIWRQCDMTPAVFMPIPVHFNLTPAGFRIVRNLDVNSTGLRRQPPSERIQCGVFNNGWRKVQGFFDIQRERFGSSCHTATCKLIGHLYPAVTIGHQPLRFDQELDQAAVQCGAVDSQRFDDTLGPFAARPVNQNPITFLNVCINRLDLQHQAIRVLAWIDRVTCVVFERNRR
ncbi:hypothetical protein D3C85_1240730 [compost metagenome]